MTEYHAVVIVLCVTGEKGFIGSTEVEDALIGIPRNERARPRRDEMLNEACGSRVKVVRIINEDESQPLAKTQRNILPLRGVFHIVDDAMKQFGGIEIPRFA